MAERGQKTWSNGPKARSIPPTTGVTIDDGLYVDEPEPKAVNISIVEFEHPPAKKRKKEKISYVWSHFVKMDAVYAKCSYCFGKYSHHGNTSNLQKHLQRNHPSVLNSTTEASEAAELTNNRAEIHKPDHSGDGATSGSAAHGSCKTIKSFFAADSIHTRDSPIYKRFMTHLQQFFADNLLPFQIVDSESFCNLISFLNKRFVPPNRKKLTSSMDEVYIRIKEQCKHEIEEVQYFSLTFDGWTDQLNSVSYLGVTVHFIVGTAMESLVIATKPIAMHHTGENLKEVLDEVLEDWNILKSKIIAVVSDGASNMKRAVQLAFPNSSASENRSLHCFAHVLNLIVQNSVEKVDQFKRLTDDIKRIVTFFKKSNNAADQLRKEQEITGMVPLKLLQECPTRWNSLYLMLERYLQLHVFVAKAKASLETASELKLPSKYDRDVLLECMELLKPIYEATTDISAENYVTGSKILPMIHCLEHAVESVLVTNSASITLQAELREAFTCRFRSFQESHLLNICTILDPRFKTRPIKIPLMKAQALTGINNQIKKIYGSTNGLQNPNGATPN